MDLEKTLVIGDVEGKFHKVPVLLSNRGIIEIADEISIILVGDIVWG
ncbi:hypothetical protein LR010_01060 [Candidatus Gracilibacteria bacterium]|nr:hypothetical protein [Candidatus Gracilibacteria bacterium]